MAETIGKINPFRYRSYYYDNETGLYYLNSRYYDPDVGRFLNADTTDVLVVDQDSLIENNLFAYCLNNPVNMADEGGDLAISAIVGGVVGGATGATLGVLLSNQLGLTGAKKAVLIAAATVGGVALGAFLGPYAVKLSRVATTAIKSGVKKVTKTATKTVVKKVVVKSTGRTTAKNLAEQIFMKSVKSSPLKNAKHLKNIVLNDSRWLASKGWIKMERMQKLSNGTSVIVHFVYNTVTGKTADFKYK